MEQYGFRLEYSYLSLPAGFYTRLEPVRVKAPEVKLLNESLLNSLGLDLLDISTEERAAIFAGNILPRNSRPFAQAYAGHQFGHFTMLGDGRALVMGEHVTHEGKRFDIQFKGSGPTPYSRRGDGRAALGPMLREYIISEAMHALGIPTTRSLAVVTTGEDVFRDTPLPGSILTRVAASHIRVGTFEFAAWQGDRVLVEMLLDYTIGRHYPEIIGADNKALSFLNSVIECQVDLVVHWMRVGFIHGVMNTDNMAVSGETIDYGPCAFMDSYDPNTFFSSIDRVGRYAYANQPLVAQWNIARLAEALLPLIDKDANRSVDLAKEAVDYFATRYRTKWLQMMLSKLGLFEENPGDEQLVVELLDLMQKNGADYTKTFRDISQVHKPTGELYESRDFANWHERWMVRLKHGAKSLQSCLNLMKDSNPAVIPRNHKVEQALEAATMGELKPCNDLLSALKEPYRDRPSLEPYQSLPKQGERVYQTFCGT